MWETLGTSSCGRDMKVFVAFKLHVSYWNKANVTLDGILTETVYPEPFNVIVSLPTLCIG